ncbi:MAG: isoprenylcysteine carboxylmethyltransferase family protein, partial [Candidatus Omnitrophica bacterium]|nr:isoprenylcysteine carboxylmethyltransferase family protein [Candidatus Omnitrophota bacterium]
MKRKVYRRRQFFFLGLLCFFISSRLLLHPWDHELLEETLDVIGLGFIVLGFIIRIAANGYLFQHLQEGKLLATHGPYRFVRHPIFLGTFMIIAGVICLFLHISFLLLFLAVWMVVFLPDIHDEEARLAERFGDKYARYQKRVPRFIPVLQSWLWLPDYFQAKLSWIKRERPSLFVAVLVTLVIEIFVDTKLFGHQEIISEVFELLI